MPASSDDSADYDNEYARLNLKLADIAERSGVARSTVSRVLNKAPGVSKDVRERVLAVIRELKYEPNKLARSLGVPSFRIEDSESHFSSGQPLTPDYLASTLTPYLKAIAEIQYVIQAVRRQQKQPVDILSIRHFSPVEVSMDGAGDAIGVVRDIVVPWRRNHAREMARLAELEKQADIEIKKAEVLEGRARAVKERQEAEKLAAEALLQKNEAQKVRLENEKLELELHRARIQLAIDTLNHLDPHLSAEDRIAYVVKLLPFLKILTESPLQFPDD
jgi:transcriptional regulator with XRE-family HTH domain